MSLLTPIALKFLDDLADIIQQTGIGEEDDAVQALSAADCHCRYKTHYISMVSKAVNFYN